VSPTLLPNYEANSPVSRSFTSLARGVFADDSNQVWTFDSATVCFTLGL
jgi:hypothetical protein